MNTAKKYFRFLVPEFLITTKRTKEILTSNPITIEQRQDAQKVFLSLYHYDAEQLEQKSLNTIDECFAYNNSQKVSWINVDGLRRADVEKLGEAYGIHPLLVEDIISCHQRPKMDEVEDVLYCLLYMLYYNSEKKIVEQEQVSIVLGKNFVITFQEDPTRDVFNPIREKLKVANSKLRQRRADYLCYTMLDLIVDNYFFVMEQLGEHIETVEEEVIRNSNTRSLARINQVRKELIVLKRNVAPVRDLLGSMIRSESDLLDERTIKYFKDVHDHIIQAYELTENYRDMMISMQDLYINNVNLRMNEVMKVMAIVTCLLAPATVIGGIFGMNFDRNVTFFHKPYGFYIAVTAMIIIPVFMLIIFKKRGWFRRL